MSECSAAPQGAPRENLAGFELFRSLSAPGLAAVRTAMRVDRYAREAVIFPQGGQAGRAYALASGSIRIRQTGRDGGEAVVRFIGPGEMFGVVPLFTDHRLPADAIAAEESCVLSWSEAELMRLIERFPRIARNVIAVLGRRLGVLQERTRELTTLHAEQRIACAVLRLSEQGGRDTFDGRTIGFPLRRKDVAQYSGTTLHTASRTLAAWESAGLLTSRRGCLTIRNLDALRRVAADGRAALPDTPSGGVTRATCAS